MKKISNLLNNLIKNEKIKQIKNRITLVLSVFVLFSTLYLLMNTAFTLSGDYKLELNDNFVNEDYSWKLENGYSTIFNLNLNFVDSDGIAIKGKNISVNVDELAVDGGFTFGSTNESQLINLLNENELEVIFTDNGKYLFDYAEVLVDGVWQRLVLDEGISSKIWCNNCFSRLEPVDKDYGWRGTYGTETIEYIINENTEFNLHYIFEANEVYEDNLNNSLNEQTPILFTANSGEVRNILYTARNVAPLSTNDSVASLGSNSGITFTLHNYSGTNHATGTDDVNTNGLFNYFTFKDLHRSDGPGVTPEYDGDGFGTNHATVHSNLDATDNPVFDCRGTCGNLNTSLGYLFGQPNNLYGEPVKGVQSYNPTNTLLQKVNRNGVEYYYYDSNYNAVDYDTTLNQFIVRNYIERGYLTTTFAGETSRGEFLPFNYLQYASNPTKLYAGDNSGRYNYESPTNKDEIDHWFGMTMEFDFYMPENGKIGDENMVFSFTGDDDVWVFIDDVLVLDLGGTHGAVDGYIDFNTGVVHSQIDWQGATTPAYTTSIADMFAKQSTVEFESNAAGTTFEDYSKHTFKFFYLERGAWISNCKIEFNIPVLPSGSLSVKKEFEGAEKYNDEYTFVAYDVTSGAVAPMGTKYTVGGVEKVIDNNNGQFKLHNNEVAIFLSKTDQDDPNGEYLRSNNYYYIQEVDTGPHSDSYSCTIDDVACPEINKTSNFQMIPHLSHSAIFKNKTKTYNLNVSKEAINSYPGELFDFQLTFKDEFGNIVNANGLTITAPNGYTINQTNNGIINFQLETAQSISVAGLPINSVIDIQELNHDGYHASIKAIEGGTEVPLVQGDTYKIDMITENKDIKVYNTPGVVLPETGGIGTLIYIVVGLSMVIASAVLSIAFIRSSKVSD